MGFQDPDKNIDNYIVYSSDQKEENQKVADVTKPFVTS